MEHLPTPTNTVTIYTEKEPIQFDSEGTIPQLQKKYKIGTIILDENNEFFATIKAVTIG